MRDYSVYIEFTNDTYSVIKCQCENDKQAERMAIDYANDKDQDIYFIEVERV
jgi:hypothetical protein